MGNNKKGADDHQLERICSDSEGNLE